MAAQDLAVVDALLDVGRHLRLSRHPAVVIPRPRPVHRAAVPAALLLPAHRGSALIPGRAGRAGELRRDLPRVPRRRQLTRDRLPISCLSRRGHHAVDVLHVPLSRRHFLFRPLQLVTQASSLRLRVAELLRRLGHRPRLQAQLPGYRRRPLGPVGGRGLPRPAFPFLLPRLGGVPSRRDRLRPFHSRQILRDKPARNPLLLIALPRFLLARWDHPAAAAATWPGLLPPVTLHRFALNLAAPLTSRRRSAPPSPSGATRTPAPGSSRRSARSRWCSSPPARLSGSLLAWPGTGTRPRPFL